MAKREYPPSKRRPKSHVCKNCEFVVVKIKLPRMLDPKDSNPADIAKVMRETSKAQKVDKTFEFSCTYLPTWKKNIRETIHFCGQFKLRENWQAGY